MKSIFSSKNWIFDTVRNRLSGIFFKIWIKTWFNKNFFATHNEDEKKLLKTHSEYFPVVWVYIIIITWAIVCWKFIFQISILGVLLISSRINKTTLLKLPGVVKCCQIKVQFPDRFSLNLASWTNLVIDDIFYEHADRSTQKQKKIIISQKPYL